MKDTIFLIFDKNGITGTRKTIPPLKAGEYSTRIDVTVDDKYFKRIIPIAKMEIDDGALIEPKMILENVEKPEDTICQLCGGSGCEACDASKLPEETP